MSEPMRCNECDCILDGDWLMITVKTGNEYVAGFLCSTDHLIDYTATVRAMELDADHPRWDVDDE